MAEKVKLKVLAAVFLASLDEIIAASLLLFLLPHLGFPVPPLYAASILGGLAFLSYLLYLIIKPALLKPPAVGAEAMVGLKGEALTSLTPRGFITLQGEIWRALSLDGEIEAGEPVRVEAVEGLTVKVRRANRQSQAPYNRSTSRL
ncbi:MAG: NfeD family protein [Candidatus Hecatellales archaeon]|nr:MAG: NfeD family protein [Candidatus Hecatellales archaeon]